MLVYFNVNWMEIIVFCNVEKYLELKFSFLCCVRKVVKIDCNLENFDILIVLNVYICIVIMCNCWV